MKQITYDNLKELFEYKWTLYQNFKTAEEDITYIKNRQNYYIEKAQIRRIKNWLRRTT